MKFKVGDKVIIINTDDLCFNMIGEIIQIKKSGYKVRWSDGEIKVYSCLSHFCRKLTKLDRALK